MEYRRPDHSILVERLKGKRQFLQVVAGPRQVGKTTLVHQVLDEPGFAAYYASADGVGVTDASWVSQQWEIARIRQRQSEGKRFVLALDEIQKISNWSEQVKKEWDADTRKGLDLQVILLGSSRLLLQQGLTESLAGRFELHYLGHWSLVEMQAAFGISPEQFAYFGGYPGAAQLVAEPDRWRSYVRDSLIEPSISRDILMLTRVNKPALLRQLFELGAAYSGQILAFNKMLGQLQDAGNTTTLAFYLELLDTAGLLAGLPKFSPNEIRKRASSPKLMVHNTALLSAVNPKGFEAVQSDPRIWGHRVESAVGAYLKNLSLKMDFGLSYWRSGNNEVDFVVEYRGQVIGIEVKSGGKKKKTGGMKAFQNLFPAARLLLIGAEGLSWQSFLSLDPESWLRV